MGTLSQETQIVQNPALGAMLLWRFAAGYERANAVRDHAPLPLLFIVLPIMLYDEATQFIESTRESSGIRSFVAKFSDSRISKNDVIFSLNERAIKLRRLSIESLKVAVSASLVAVDIPRGVAISLSSTQPRSRIPQSIRTMLRSSEKLGTWCSEVSLHEVSSLLKVRF